MLFGAGASQRHPPSSPLSSFALLPPSLHLKTLHHSSPRPPPNRRLKTFTPKPQNLHPHTHTPTPTAAIAALWVVIPNRYDFTTLLPPVSGFLDAQKAGIPLEKLPAASQAAYSWVEMPAGVGDAVQGGWFMTGWDYVKVRGLGLGAGGWALLN